MTRTTTYAIASALIISTIMTAAASININSPADAATLPIATPPGTERPVRSTKGDRLDAGPEIRWIAGVTVVLRDFDHVIR